MHACMEVDGRGEKGKYIYLKGYQHGQAIQLLSVIMLHDLRVTVCGCSEGNALFHIKSNNRTAPRCFPTVSALRVCQLVCHEVYLHKESPKSRISILEFVTVSSRNMMV